MGSLNIPPDKQEAMARLQQDMFRSQAQEEMVATDSQAAGDEELQFDEDFEDYPQPYALE